MSDPSGHPTYLITNDLGEKVEYLRHTGLITPDPHSTFFTDVQSDLQRAVDQATPANVTVRSVKMNDLADDVLARALTFAKDDTLIVSTCPEIANPVRGFTLQVNRLVDFDGNSIGLGPRPGNPSIRDQILAIKNKAGGMPIIIVEDGIFSGETMLFVIDQLRAHNVKVSAMIVGFTFPSSAATVQKIKEAGIDFVSIEEFQNLFDWVPDHDFFPFVPSNGKVVGIPVKQGYLPFYSYDQASYSVPYLYGFCPINKWASIDDEPAKALTTFCIRATVDLYREIERSNGRTIMISDLIHAKQRVSIPVSVWQQHLPHSDVSVISYLSEVL